MFKIERGKPGSSGDSTIYVEAGEGKITVEGNNAFVVEMFKGICGTEAFGEWMRRVFRDIPRDEVMAEYFAALRRAGLTDLADRYETELSEGAAAG
jgi:hypothetical protein